MKKNKEIYYKEVVIGSSLEALIYAYQRELPVIHTSYEKPFRFDYCPIDYGFPILGLNPESTQISTNNGFKQIGLSQENTWERLYFLMSLRGYIPFANLAKSIRRTETGATILNDVGRLIDVKFDKCYYFWDQGASGFTIEADCVNDYLVYDWIYFNSGGTHEYDLFEFNDKFCNQVWFYRSERPRVKSTVKDACVVSQMTFNQLNDFDYSETMIVYELKKRLKSIMQDKIIKLTIGKREIKSKNYPSFSTTDEKIVSCHSLDDYTLDYKQEYQLYLKGYEKCM